MSTKSIRRMRSGLAIASVAAFWLMATTGAMAESIDGSDERLENEAGMGVASAAASLLYGPAKLIYAGGGGLVAGMAYLVSAGDSDVTMPILNASMRGDYVLTPSHLQGRQPIEFVGRNPEARELQDQSSAWENANQQVLPAVDETVEVDSTYKTEDEFGPWERPQASVDPADAWVTENVGRAR